MRDKRKGRERRTGSDMETQLERRHSEVGDCISMKGHAMASNERKGGAKQRPEDKTIQKDTTPRCTP
jgi:hypothetical protein